MIGSTMIRSSLLKGSYITPEVVNAVEWFNNSIPGAPRQVASKGLFQALQPDGNRLHVEITNLYHPSNLPNEQDVIYLHEWSAH